MSTFSQGVKVFAVCRFLGLASLMATTITATSTSATTTTTTTTTTTRSPPRVKVQAYTEALCPGCKEFALQELIPTYQTLGDDIVDFEWIPFGNAKLDEATQMVTCQHDVGECDANTWEQCAAFLYPQPNIYIPFFQCLEDVLPMGSATEPFDPNIFQNCSTTMMTTTTTTTTTNHSNSNFNSNSNSNIHFPDLAKCHDNPFLRWNLQRQAAYKTPKDHTYVPWIVINGKWLDIEPSDRPPLLTAVCIEYAKQGGSHPACHATSPPTQWNRSTTTAATTTTATSSFQVTSSSSSSSSSFIANSSGTTFQTS